MSPWKSPPRDWRDEKLWKLLPAIDAPYQYDSLSVAEMEALFEALSDGFGEPIQGREPLPLRLKSAGLLEHAFHPSRNFDADDWDYEFLIGDGNEPAPYETFPLGFNPRRLLVYFQNQFNRFCNRRDLGGHSKMSDQEIAALRLYRKPWYEFHALRFLDFIDFSRVQFAGQLGRLVEQYYWRFRFEKVAMTGVGAKKGASAGGKAKAQALQPEHSAWQNAASEIWADRPKLSKIAVANIISKQNGGRRTAKHIARYITHP
jgi:hypothetical protein